MTPLDQNAMKHKTTAAASALTPVPETSPAALSAPPGVAALWHAVSRRWLTILVFGGALGAVGAAVGWYAVPAKYTAVATLHLDPHPPRGLDETHEDYLGVRCRYRGFGWILPPDFQMRTTPKAFFRIAKALSRIEYTGPFGT